MLTWRILFEENKFDLIDKLKITVDEEDKIMGGEEVRVSGNWWQE